MVAFAEPKPWSNSREKRNPHSGSRPRMPRVALVPAKRIREDAYPRFSDARLGYRFYKPETGTWVNRDPAGEENSENLYGFVFDNPVGLTDFLGAVANPPPPVWSMQMAAVNPNPEWVPNAQLDYRIHIAFFYPRNLPSGSTQVWLLNKIESSYLTTDCEWGKTVLYVIDVGTYRGGRGPVTSIDTDVRASWTYDYLACLYYSTVTKTHGFNPAGTLAPTGPDRDIDEATYNLRMGQLVGPTHVAEVKYSFETASKCSCCPLVLPGNYERIQVPGLGSWGGGW